MTAVGNKLALVALVGLVACGSTNPFTEESTDTGGTTTTTATGIFGDSPPPGTSEPTASSGIVRSEPVDGNGAGVASNFSYDSATDTFTVDNLGFDGDNTYVRDDQVPTLQNSPNAVYAIYENAATQTDPVSGATIDQFTHKALYSRSTSGATQFAIVRTGAFSNYGFGGFAYQRNGSIVLPTTGQGIYTGDYGALRDYEGIAELEYVTGDMTVLVDFSDPNGNNAVTGSITNRRIFGRNGTDRTDSYLTALGTANDTTYTELPTVQFVLQSTGNMDNAGEMTGEVQSAIVNGEGVSNVHESGTYYGLVGGATGNELVGIVVMTSSEPRGGSITARETGGFILVR